MSINLNLPQSPSSNHFKVQLLIETLPSGKFAASIWEFPDCRVEAPTREAAITQVKTALLERIKHMETISWDVPITTSQPKWMQFAGVFEDDPDFQAIMSEIRAERTSDDESEVDPSYYL
jgi:predicted RNase H-like HicB family nuclease